MLSLFLIVALLEASIVLHELVGEGETSPDSYHDAPKTLRPEYILVSQRVGVIKDQIKVEGVLGHDACGKGHELPSDATLLLLETV